MIARPLREARKIYSYIFSYICAWSYDFPQFLIGARKARFLLARQLTIDKYESVLDLGCGTGMLPPYLSPSVRYVGVDICPRRVALARKRWKCHQFLVADATNVSLDTHQRFQLIVAVGLLHHLDDQGAQSLLHQVRDLLEAGGNALFVDPVFFDKQSLFSRFLCMLDAGSWVRSSEGYRSIVPEGLMVMRQQIRSDLLWMPQSLHVMELVGIERDVISSQD